MFGANDENEDMMTKEELQSIQRNFWHNLLKTLAVSLLALGYYLYLKG
jgi:hypothetical protein